MTRWEIESRRGIGVGIGLMAAIVLVDAGMIWLAVDRARASGSIGVGTFFIGLAAAFSLLLLALIGYRVYGLARSWYLLDRNALIIHWGATEQVIPMGQVERVLTGDEVEGRIQFYGGMWPGHWVGPGYVPGEGPSFSYSVAPPRQQIYVVTSSGFVYGISPAKRDEFLEALRQRWEMGPTQVVELTCKRPGFANWSIWSDRLGLALLAAGLAAVVALVGFLCFRFPALPPTVPLHFDAAGNPDRIVARGQSFIIPLIGLLTLIFNGALGLATHRRERMASYLLWGGAVLIQVLMWTATLGILARL